ncbi:diacylglycerol/lipid kinase family protein [Peptoniphilus obesi]|uniref:diacylglycerol/lipid kinase family protein n=1 Tax=Peptoniphilus obesi TaxID=1472765 RepID=UPI0004AD6BAA|nr:diacylglycerol kinase family protein [Peptoniphilus obesi]
MKKVMVILNPDSGSGKSVKMEDLLSKKLKKHFEIIDFRISKDIDDVINFASIAAETNYDSIVVSGGDGTINSVVQGIYDKEHRPKIAIIPSGTGNLLSKHLGIPQIRREAINRYDFEHSKKIDIGLCNDKCFCLFVSMGSIPEAIHDASGEDKSKFGMLTYFKESIERLRKDKYYRLKIETDDGNYEGEVDHFLVSISNKIGYVEFTRQNSSMDSGYANVLILKKKDIFSRLSGAGSAIAGELDKNSNVEHFLASKLHVESLEGEEETDIDGDKGPSLPIDIQILKQRVEFYLPASYF